jgi:hypothetical protein
MTDIVKTKNGRVVTTQTAWWYGQAAGNIQVIEKLFCIHNVRLTYSCNECKEA